jgi:RimJ/RimL family protein N-acetyltransferase
MHSAASAREVADTMISLPHPYPAGEAERYVARRQSEREAGRSVAYAIEKKADRGFYGLIEIRDIEREHSQGELSFWLAVDAWGQRYMSEAVRAVVGYAFATLGLNRLYAYHMVRNPASGRVLAKNGFEREGLLRQRVRKWGQFEDVALWAVLRQEWQAAQGDCTRTTRGSRSD